MAEDNQKKKQTGAGSRPAPEPTEKKASMPAGAGTKAKPVQKETEPKAGSGSKSAEPKTAGPKVTGPKVTEQKAEPARPAIAPEPATEKPKVRLWPLWVIILILFIIIAGMGGAGFLGWKEMQSLKSGQPDYSLIDAKSEQAISDNQALRDEITSLNSSLSQVKKDVSRKQQQLQQIKQNLQAGITTNATKILQIGGTTRTEWLLSEAEYLLRLANQRLHFEKDVAGTVAILQTADEVLHDSGDAGVYPVREQIKKEIVELKSQSLVDEDGIYLELEAVIGMLDQLDQKVFASEPESETGKNGMNKQSQAEADTKADADIGLGITVQVDSDNWLQKLRQDLTPLFIFRKLDEPVEPLLSPEQTYYLKQNLRLMMEQAQLALMKKNQPLYEKSISKAYQWVATYFLDSNRKTKVLLENLEELKKQDVDPEIPVISESLTLLKERISELSRRSGNSRRAAAGSEG
ncbi:MAG: hypothetical protein CSB48_04735 [Proteobacteria bacterium]|nr:MAG: hypothetical protein CSB48_04735 [Pseudomonadota bacterium]